WFESGSMPDAQLHYPFENAEVFEASFPAEFIAEGLDQTRGWFYTLTVLAAALYDKPAFRNVIVNGMVSAEDGKKMSKRLRNYTPPDQLMETYGADALRLYLINSGLVRGDEQRFSDTGVRDITRRALLPWYNAFSFLKTYAEIDQWSPDKGHHLGENILDRWILSRLQTLKTSVTREMNAYRLYNVVPQLFTFIEEMTNWYIRLNRSRFWVKDITADKIAAYSTLYTALLELSQVMAPFAPFLSEYVYRELANLSGTPPNPESVHHCDYPESEEPLVQPELEIAVDRMQQVILLGRQKREDVKVGLRTPLRRLTVINRDESLLTEMGKLEGYLRSELNVHSVAYSADESAFIELGAKPNFPLLGKRLGKRMKEFQGLINNLSADQISDLQANGSIDLNGERFDDAEIEVVQQPKAGTNTVSNRFIAVDLDCTLDDELVRGGYARAMVRILQDTRKEKGLNVIDRVAVRYDGHEALILAAEEHREYIMSETLATTFDHDTWSDQIQKTEIDGKPFRFHVSKATFGQKG
ncbi:MAG: DUF5915 domain-containing protein, partial [Proteobacteria bacterium]|nr:DUF5915 domain-containing protein [Pseudomonadota bacterium]